MERLPKDQGLIFLKNRSVFPFCDLYSPAVSVNQEGVLFVLVLIGCALGGVARHLLAEAVSKFADGGFPWGTLLVNMVGSCLLGLFLGHGAAELRAGSHFHGFVAIGFCGGLTTFSTFSLQTLTLVSQQRWKQAMVKVIGGSAACVALVWLGFELGERIAG